MTDADAEFLGILSTKCSLLVANSPTHSALLPDNPLASAKWRVHTPSSMERKNPFPGMNPFMEQTWPDVHLRLISRILEALGTELPDELFAKGELQVDVLGDSSGKAQPDIAVVEESWKGGLPPVWTAAPAFQSLVVTEPALLAVESPKHRWIEIRSALGELIAVIEVLSPANKEQHRSAYIAKRDSYIAAKVNLVEIDLVRRGQRTVDVEGCDYDGQFGRLGEHGVICVSRGTHPGRREIYACPLRERLPVIRIPLRATDPDIPLDIQDLVDRCYESGRYWMLDYNRPPHPPFSTDDFTWVRERLLQAGLVV